MLKIAPSQTLRPAEETRHRLLDAAERVFARDGLHGATTREIAKQAKVNEVTLFRHFQNKEKLLAAVFEHSVAIQADALADSEPWTRNLHQDLLRYARMFDAMLTKNEALLRTMIGEARRHPEHARQIIHEAVKASRAKLIAYLQASREEGAIRADVDLNAAVDLFTGMLLSGMLRRTAGAPLSYSRETYLTTCVDILVRGIETTPTATGSGKKAKAAK